MSNIVIFPEKRTRSQITLPDDILQIPLGSPMKDARSALRNHTSTSVDASSSSDSKRPSDDANDEAILSPINQTSLLGPLGNAKRSASPPPQDEYSPPSGSPEGRLLKRVRRELGPADGTEGDAENTMSLRPIHKASIPGHTHHHLDFAVPATSRRSARKRSATNRKLIPALSASPPPSTFSPNAGSSKQGRAQSVPLFPPSHDIPHIDLRNPPPSPKRSRARSKSPSKNPEARLRPLLATFSVIEETPGLQDGTATPMDLDAEAKSEEDGENKLERLHVPESSLESQATPTVIKPSSHSPPTLTSTSTTFTAHNIPATPASQSLNTLIPMSPLTPLPETPLPPRLSNTNNRYSSNVGWGLTLITENDEQSKTPLFPPVVESSAIKSRLPRPASSMAPPPAPPTKVTRPSMTSTSRPPSSATGPSTKTTVATASKNPAAPVAKKDAFALMMKRSREDKERTQKEKARQRTTNPTAPLNMFASVTKAKNTVTHGSLKTKVKMKDKMRPKMKSRQEALPQTVLGFDEEEEEEGAISEHDAFAEAEVFAEPRPSFQPEVAPVIIPEGPPVTPTRFSLRPFPRPPSLPDEVGMEVVEDSDSEGQTPVQPLVDAGPAEYVLKEDVETIPTPVVEAIKETSSEIQASNEPLAEPIGDTASDTIVSNAVANAPELKNEDESHANPQPTSRTKASRLPLGKRHPSAAVAGGRVTRSVSNSKKKLNEAEASTSAARHEHPKAIGPGTVKQAVSQAVKKSTDAPGSSKADTTNNVKEKMALPPGSPMKLSSPAKNSKPDTPKKTPNRFTFSTKPISRQSPTKIEKPSSLFSMNSSSLVSGSTFSMAPSQVALGASSSLSTLSNALEKLRMPAPSRPSTSMGFNRDAPDNSDDDKPAARTKDDVGVGRTSFALGRPQGLKRANTLETDLFGPSMMNPVVPSSKPGTSTGKALVQKPLSMYMSSKGATSKAGNSNILRGTGQASTLSNRSIFGVGGGPRRTISKKTTLPMVIGSPVKGGLGNDIMQEDDEDLANEVQTQIGEKNDEAPLVSEPQTQTTLLSKDLSTTEGAEKGKGKEQDHKASKHSRRVSMVSHALSQSLSAMPPPPLPQRGLMGPPATPPHAGRSPKRSTSSSYPSTSAGGSSPSQPGTTGTRASARIAKIAPLVGKAKTDGAVKKSASDPALPFNPNVEALKVLKDCVIFVDVKTDTGDEAGSLFVEMLEGVGARVLTRVGQTCTHIVYKNGLMSTLSRYRLLRDPKPLVVGIAWVVECVEQRKHVDEADFLVDIESTNIAGVNKRRRSVLPKLFSTEIETLSSEADKEEDADRSMDGSTSSITADDDLAPLERARRRKSLMVGLRA